MDVSHVCFGRQLCTILLTEWDCCIIGEFELGLHNLRLKVSSLFCSSCGKD